MESGIYMLTCKINGHRYIGQSQNIQRRMWEHKHQRNLPHLPISRAIKKYGWENFDKEVLEFCPVSELNEKEIYYIATLKPEYNISKGGESGMRGYKHSIETKNKCRLAAIDEWNNKSDEEKEFVLKHQLIGKPFEKGHNVPNTVREKLRQANLGKKQSEETKEKRSNKMKVAMKGNKNGNKSVRCIENGETYDSIKIAGITLGISITGITHHLKGKQKSVGGYHFEYHNSVETSRDECSGVGEKMSCSSKCTATLKVEEIVRAVEMVN